MVRPSGVSECRTERPSRRVSIRYASRSTFACSEAEAGLIPTVPARSAVPRGSHSAQRGGPRGAEQHGQVVVPGQAGQDVAGTVARTGVLAVGLRRVQQRVAQADTVAEREHRRSGPERRR